MGPTVSPGNIPSVRRRLWQALHRCVCTERLHHPVAFATREPGRHSHHSPWVDRNQLGMVGNFSWSIYIIYILHVFGERILPTALVSELRVSDLTVAEGDGRSTSQICGVSHAASHRNLLDCSSVILDGFHSKTPHSSGILCF